MHEVYLTVVALLSSWIRSMRPFSLPLVPTELFSILPRDNRRCLEVISNDDVLVRKMDYSPGRMEIPSCIGFAPKPAWGYLAAFIWFILGECRIGASSSFLFTLILDCFRSYQFHCGNLTQKRYLSSNRLFTITKTFYFWIIDYWNPGVRCRGL